jgi:hypothetical protein
MTAKSRSRSSETPVTLSAKSPVTLARNTQSEFQRIITGSELKVRFVTRWLDLHRNRCTGLSWSGWLVSCGIRSQRDRGLLPHCGLTRRTPVCSGKAGSFCGSAALPRAQARQLRAHARGSRPELAEGVVMAICTRLRRDPALDRRPQSGQHRTARLTWPTGGSTQ